MAKQAQAQAPARGGSGKAAPREAEPETEATGTAVTTKAVVGSVPSYLAEDVVKDAGKGVSKLASDNLVPLVYILQPMSPQVLNRNPAYIEGAKAGDIWLRNSPQPIVDGEGEGILFQPCYYNRCVNEWIHRDDGGGFVTRHKLVTPDETMDQFIERMGGEKVVDPKNTRRVSYRAKNGNQYIETREHTGFVLGRGAPMPYVIPMTSTQHTTSRGWMFMMNTKTDAEGRTPPSFALVYRLKTKYRTNTQGEWYGWDVEDFGWVQTRDDYLRGRTLFEAFDTGAKQAEAPVGGMGEDGAADGAAGGAGEEDENSDLP